MADQGGFRGKILAAFYHILMESAPGNCYPVLIKASCVSEIDLNGKGFFSVIPCQKSCSTYCEGCHKNCAQWAVFQTRLRAERQAKKDYLKYYNELCGAVTRQFRAIGAYCAAR